MKKKYLKIFLPVVVFLFLLSILFVVNAQKISVGTKIAGATINTRKPSPLRELVDQQWFIFSNEIIVFSYEDFEATSTLNELGFEMNAQQTIDNAYAIGKEKGYFINTKEQFLALFGRYNVPLVVNTDQEKFNQKTLEIFGEIEKPVKNATLILESDKFVTTKEEDGIAVNRDELLASLLTNIENLEHNRIQLNVEVSHPVIESNETGKAIETANRLLENLPYRFSLAGTTWIIGQERFVSWLEFKPISDEELGVSIKRDEIKEYLGKINWNINQAPVNAKLEINGNKAVAFTAPQDGYGVKMDSTVDRFIENISSNPAIKTTEIIADKTSPKTFLKDTNNLGINGLIGQGVSNFAGSPANRIHNIKTGSAKLNYLILKPSEEFSFNNMLGNSGPEEGYLPELVIKNNETIAEYGGGLCQLSTTMFRAAVYAGLKIVERRPHAFPFGYYYPHGFDATVYNPKPDLRFVNDTPGSILFEIIVYGSSLTINVYGTDDGREVVVKGPYTIEVTESGSLRTVLTQEIYQKGELIRKEDFYSLYKSLDLLNKED